MIPVIHENIYDLALISKVKKYAGKRLKKIVKNLRNLEEQNIKEFSSLKIKVFEEDKEEEKEIEKEEEKNPEFKIVAPIFGFQHYFKDFKKSDSKSIVNDYAGLEGENTLSTVDDNKEEIKQVGSSDFDSDE